MAWPLSLLRFAADVICPERCAACETIVSAGRLFCAACRVRVRRLRGPECPRCGRPIAPGAPCDECSTRPSLVRHARAWAAYRGGDGESPVARAIAAFKYDGAERLGPRLAATLPARVPDPGIELIVPVPLHPRRLRQRGFNQSAVLARRLGRLLGRPSAPALVVRTRDTPSQTALDLDARMHNLAGAFTVRSPDLVAGRTVLVVDDVWTSGATARALAATLQSAGAAAVDVVTIARVL